jgi:uncharacterized protein
LRSHSNEIKSVQRRHIPQRSCVVCRQEKNKKDLIRLVKNGDTVFVDAEGKMPGRGAYLCQAYECWESALNKDRLDFVLRARITEKTRGQLIEYSKTFQTKKV